MKQKFNLDEILKEQKERFVEAEKSLKLLHQTAKKLYALNWKTSVLFDVNYNMYLEFKENLIVLNEEFEGEFGPYYIDSIRINISKNGEIDIVDFGPLLRIKYEDIKKYSEEILAMAIKNKQ